MKYKVTITSTDLTGHEDVEVQEIINYDYLPSIVSANDGKTILIEPMPEKQKVTVWSFVFNYLLFKGSSVISSLDKNYAIHCRDEMINRGCKVSEIKSMEVEI